MSEKLIKTPILPEHIDTSRHLWDSFGHTETEISAGYIIRMCQEKGSWEPFTYEEIEEFYQQFGYKNFRFNALVEPVTERLFDGRRVTFGGSFIRKREDGTYEITEKFKEKAFKSSPAITSE